MKFAFVLLGGVLAAAVTLIAVAATALSAAVTGGAVLNGSTASGETQSSATAGWTRPASGPLSDGFRTPQRPDHNGIDFAAAKGSPIHAAAAGTVTVVVCQATHNGHPYSCDLAGSLSVQGCGWYVEILHADQIVTRYCHQFRRPLVGVGQHVDAGQTIGLVGASGNVTGPHLHFEVHKGNPATGQNAIDPAQFLRAHGVAVTS